MDILLKLIHHFRRFIYYRKRVMLPDLSYIADSCAAGGQDLFISGLLGNKRDGVFFDIGANDGTSISNSFYFEKHLGWTGIAVEPVASAFTALKNNRRCIAVNGCIASAGGKVPFIELTGQNMFSTLAQHNTGLTRRRLLKRAKRSQSELRQIEVDCFTVADLAAQHKISAIDFLSVDTEGGELEILKQIDFHIIPVSVISVENNYYTDKIKAYLESKEFVYIGTFRVDEIYIHRSLLKT